MNMIIVKMGRQGLVLAIFFLMFPVAWANSADYIEKSYQRTGSSEACKFSVLIPARPVLKDLIRHMEQNLAPETVEAGGVEYRGKANLYSLQQAMYQNNLINLDPLYYWLSDKKLMADLLAWYLGPKIEKFHPKTLAALQVLKLAEANSINTLVISLENEFPQGVIVKNRIGEASGGEGFAIGYKSAARKLYRADKNELENLIVQETVAPIESAKMLDEYRVHTMWGKVIPNTTLSRWKILTRNHQARPVEVFVQRFLDLLPLSLRQQQAWSLDVIKIGPMDYRIVDINLADVRRENWSGFLQNPVMLTHLTQFLESEFGWTFPGRNGFLLKHYLGNLGKARRKIRNMYRKHGLKIKPAK